MSNSVMENTRQNSHSLISVVVPAHNEEAGIDVTISVIFQVLNSCTSDSEIIVIDDGSTDNTYAIVRDLCATYHNLKAIKLSRNFGKESALLAGLRATAGDAVITLDADLQHPPTVIPEMIEKWKSGYKVVHAIKRLRATNTLFERWRAAVYNNLVKLMGGVDLRNSSDYKLLDKQVVRVIINDLHEYTRFYRGLATWVGFAQTNLYFDVAARNAGDSKWSTRSLISLAITGVISFTSMPLRIVTFLGLLTLVLAFFVANDALWSWFNGTAVSGFTTLIITLLLTGSFIMISLGILGEYVAKIYAEVKGRPAFIVDQTCGFTEDIQHE
jgi:glycosyltransferase involved in cell wall biosynthesis